MTRGPRKGTIYMPFDKPYMPAGGTRKLLGALWREHPGILRRLGAAAPERGQNP